jgi:hypothetical protein
MEQELEQVPAVQDGPNRSDLDALKDGAAMLSAAGNRVAALSLLWSAVAIDPLDLAAHRRLAATMASGGDLDGAADEFARYIDFVLPLGDLTRAMLELTYGVNMLGGRAQLRGVAEKIASAVLALVPPSDAALPLVTSEPLAAATLPELQITIEPEAADVEIEPVAADHSVEPVTHDAIDLEALLSTTAVDTPAVETPELPIADLMTPSPEIVETVATRVDEWATPTHEWTAPLPLAPDRIAERAAAEAIVRESAAREPIFLKPKPAPAPALSLVPKVPFRFCLHPGGDRHWMQLEGGAPGLVPDAVRVIDRFENVVEERLCLPMRAGDKGHSPITPSFDSAPLVWVVVSVPSQIVAAYEAGLTWAYTFQARVNGQWLALDLVDSGCRLSKVRPLSAS